MMTWCRSCRVLLGVMTLVASTLRAADPAPAVSEAKSAAAKESKTKEPVPPPADRILLFDGGSMIGWEVLLKDPKADPTDSWWIKDGVLGLTGKPHGYVYTARAYANYRLHAEWRWVGKGGNSGIFLHVQPKHAIWPDCVEVQLTHGSAGGLTGNGDVRFSGGTVKDGKQAGLLKRSTELKAGQWNVCEVTCLGDTVEVVINGARMNLVEGVSVSSGQIGLQLEGTPIEFRNIWIVQL